MLRPLMVIICLILSSTRAVARCNQTRPDDDLTVTPSSDAMEGFRTCALLLENWTNPVEVGLARFSRTLSDGKCGMKRGLRSQVKF